MAGDASGIRALLHEAADEGHIAGRMAVPDATGTGFARRSPATAAVAVITAFLLSMKKWLHRWVARIKRLGLEAFLKLGLLSIVILPILPDQGYGPGTALNPYQIWWAVVLVAGLSFFEHAAIRLGGASLCLLMTGLFGGLPSVFGYLAWAGNRVATG